MNNFFNKEISVKMFMISFVILNMLYIIPFILSPYLFMDDTVRIVVGNPDWGWQGRPLADFMMYLLSSDNNKIVNLFPFPLLLALVFYFYTIYYIVEHHLNSIKIYSLFSFLLILCSPLFVHNLLYKYDSAPMILGFSDDNKQQLKIIKNIKPIIETKFYNIYKVNNSSIIYFKIKKGVSEDSLKRQ